MIPKVSVVIPTYNSADTISRAVESVLTQTYPNIETIVIDDGSTDSTRKALSTFTDRIRYVLQKNRGRSAARNHGIALATGEFLAFLDADDWWLAEKIALQVTALTENPDVGLTYSGRIIVRSDGSMRTTNHRDLQGASGSDAFARLVMFNFVGSPSFVMVRKDVLNKIGGFDLALHGTEDWDLWLRIAALYKIAYIPNALACYQIHNANHLDRILRRNPLQAWPKILDKAFSIPSVIEQYGDLEPAARARMFVRCALIRCARDDTRNGKEDLQRAFELYPVMFSSPISELARDLMVFLNDTMGAEFDVATALGFLERFWSMVPESAQVGLTQEKRQLTISYLSRRYFQAVQDGDNKSVRNIASSLIQHDSSWLLNRGFILLWLKSLIMR